MTLTQIIVACVLVQVCGDAGKTASHWIRHTKSKTRAQRKRMKAWEQHRLQLLAQLLHDERKAEATKWRYPPTQTYAHCRQAAYDFIAEMQLHAWVQKQNLETGVAPTSEELLSEYFRLWPHAGVPGIKNTAQAVFVGKPAFKRKWAERWRRRWKVSYGKLKILPPMTAGECEKKVISGRRFRTLFCPHFWALIVAFLLVVPKSGDNKKAQNRRRENTLFPEVIIFFLPG